MTTNEIRNLVVQIANRRIKKIDSKQGYQSKWYAYVTAKNPDTNQNLVLTITNYTVNRSGLNIADLRNKLVVINKGEKKLKNGRTCIQAIDRLSIVDINQTQVGNGHIPVAQPATPSLTLYITEPIHKDHAYGKTALHDKTNLNMWQMDASKLTEKLDREILLADTLIRITNPLIRSNREIYYFESVEILEEPDRYREVSEGLLMVQISAYEGPDNGLYFMPKHFGTRLQGTALLSFNPENTVRVSWDDVWQGTGYGQTGTQAFPKACQNLNLPDPVVWVKGQIDLSTGRYRIRWEPEYQEYPDTNPVWQPALLVNAEITPYNFEKRNSQWDLEFITSEAQFWKMIMRERNELALRNKNNVTGIEELAQAHGITITWSEATKQSRVFLDNLIGPNPNIYDAKTDIYEIAIELSTGIAKKYSFLHENKQGATYRFALEAQSVEEIWNPINKRSLFKIPDLWRILGRTVHATKEQWERNIALLYYAILFQETGVPEDFAFDSFEDLAKLELTTIEVNKEIRKLKFQEKLWAATTDEQKDVIKDNQALLLEGLAFDDIDINKSSTWLGRYEDDVLDIAWEHRDKRIRREALVAELVRGETTRWNIIGEAFKREKTRLRETIFLDLLRGKNHLWRTKVPVELKRIFYMDLNSPFIAQRAISAGFVGGEFSFEEALDIFNQHRGTPTIVAAMFGYFASEPMVYDLSIEQRKQLRELANQYWEDYPESRSAVKFAITRLNNYFFKIQYQEVGFDAVLADIDAYKEDSLFVARLVNAIEFHHLTMEHREQFLQKVITEILPTHDSVFEFIEGKLTALKSYFMNPLEKQEVVRMNSKISTISYAFFKELYHDLSFTQVMNGFTPDTSEERIIYLLNGLDLDRVNTESRLFLVNQLGTKILIERDIADKVVNLINILRQTTPAVDYIPKPYIPRGRYVEGVRLIEIGDVDEKGNGPIITKCVAHLAPIEDFNMDTHEYGCQTCKSFYCQTCYDWILADGVCAGSLGSRTHDLKPLPPAKLTEED